MRVATVLGAELGPWRKVLSASCDRSGSWPPHVAKGARQKMHDWGTVAKPRHLGVRHGRELDARRLWSQVRPNGLGCARQIERVVSVALRTDLNEDTGAQQLERRVSVGVGAPPTQRANAGAKSTRPDAGLRLQCGDYGSDGQQEPSLVSRILGEASRSVRLTPVGSPESFPRHTETVSAPGRHATALRARDARGASKRTQHELSCAHPR